MSCLSANINLSSSNLWANVEMPSQLKAAVGVANSLDAGVTVPSALDVRIGVMGVRIDAEASIICEPNIGERRILEVTPTMIWLTEENGYSQDVEVVSNVDWRIE